MAKIFFLIFQCTWPLTVLSAVASAVFAQSNVIVIVADDAGYADWGFMDGVNGSNPTASDIPTPNLDTLANRGVRFSRAYVAQSCQPTRAALVTGGYQNRIGNEVVGDNVQGLPEDATTIWDRMKSQGYTTGAVGKWHLGSVAGPSGNRPETQGVDEFYGIWHGSRTYNLGNTALPQSQLLREVIVQPGGSFTDNVVESAHSGEYFTNTMGDYAVDFIADHHDDANPFFLYQSFTAPHTPLQNSPDFNDPRLAGLSGDRKTYASMMLTMDKEIGRIIDRLDDPDGNGDNSDSITDNTLIMFVNDNGGADAASSSPNGADNGVLRRGKGSAFEGGIRVPMIVAGAGVNQAVHGTTYDKPVHGVDILPTAVAAGGGSIGPSDAGIDGTNLLPFINGSDTSNPHDVLVHRHRTQFAVIKGDMKLVWTGGSPASNPSQAHQLYNLATDVSETNDISGSNPALVAELHRDLTNHEVTFDKQRYAILGQTAEATINTFDHFRFDPAVSGATGGTHPVIQGALGNGDFELDSGSPLAFEEVTNWHNIEGGDVATNFGHTGGMAGSPQPNSQGAFIFGQMAGNDTGHTVTAAGEVFDISFAANRFGGGWDGDETFEVKLFSSAGAVDANTGVGDIDILSTTSFVVQPGWDNYSQTGIYTTTAADIGKTIYLGMDFEEPDGGNRFPRLDVIELFVTTQGGSGTIPTTDWSDTGAWFEAGTSNVETMFHSDAFAGAVLEFPTTDAGSYISNNDMVRSTGLEYMLNKVILSGNFNGAADQSATIRGNAVLFTNDLDGVGPQIAVDATNDGASNYSFNVDLDFIMYSSLEIAGDGDVTVTINGTISDYSKRNGLTKSGTSTVVLTANNTYGGDTAVEAGTLSITNGYLEDSADVYLSAGAIFDLNFVGTDTIDSLFIDGISQATGTWGAIGSGANNESSLLTGTGLLLVSTLATVTGDFDGDGDVDGADFLRWQRDDRSANGLAAWQTGYANSSLLANSASVAVPEPACLSLLFSALCFLGLRWI